mmetsp:Transcript_67554/g.162186  ORF Transcript_67554/g.162186 Transcript_67554/m.162186 type:complete len:729 (-) Transcript_67554:155-2341(-)|eukprot:CAMPEP_0178411284 /NCGR_PEP_ID=MMETSP0689_2-20121128/21414_1 /TAXON_ID=160604 /ORGANISM="Amphidinium massartii, Strain CS-259" /LENGTH=728 /DNA_ID=CAMNT_0020032483 /DNA_START=48 /DNA_END=2234 /DNA_ORIENTATION=-
MPKKKGTRAAKAKARRDNRSPSPDTLFALIDSCDVLVLPDGNRVRRGLTNLGNTCFMNSIVQCLNASLPFSDELLMTASSAGLDGLSGSLCTVFKGIRAIDESSGGSGGGGGGGSNGSFAPKSLREQLISRFPWYRGKNQQDAHEFLRTLLGSITDEKTMEETRAAKESKTEGEQKNGSSQISSLCELCVTRNFRGHFCAATFCWGCQSVSLQLDAFLDVSLELPHLSAQTIGALGVTPARLSGAKEPSDVAEDDDQAAKAKAKAKAKSKSAAKAKPATRAPQGVWGARKEAAEVEEAMTSVKQYLARVYQRFYDPDAFLAEMQTLAAAVAAAEEAEPSGPRVEIELKRAKTSTSWGLSWNKTSREESKLVLADIKEDTPLDKWNLKKHSLGAPDEAVCVGDELVSVNESTTLEDMLSMLASANQVSLVFVRGAPVGAPKRSVKKEDIEDEEDEKKRQLAAERDQRRLEFGEVVKQCTSALPKELLEVFGPQAVSSSRNMTLQLEDCFKRFSLVEAMEEDYKPVYRCSKCSKSSSSATSKASAAAAPRTFASRRLWLWPLDLPPILTLQLKRFRRYDDRYEKSTAKVLVQETLDLRSLVMQRTDIENLKGHLSKGAEFCERYLENPPQEDELLYELYAVCEHRGDSMQMGHYVAFVNSGDSLSEERWYGLSDTKVWKCSRKEVLDAEAYVAFYRRSGRKAAVAASDADDRPKEEASESAEPLHGPDSD